jgi:hypothetical protein
MAAVAGFSSLRRIDVGGLTITDSMAEWLEQTQPHVTVYH